MQVSVTDAKAQLTDLLRCAEAGDEIILTRHGKSAVRLVPVSRKLARTERRRNLEGVRFSAKQKVTSGTLTAWSQDLQYDATGLPK